MTNLAKAKSKALAKARSEKSVQDKGGTLAQIRAEGYEDYTYSQAQQCSYQGKEAEAYTEGWRQAHLEMTGIKL